MTVMLGFSDGDAFTYESKYTTLEKVIFEVMSKRFIEHNGVNYMTTALVKIGPV